MRRDASSQRPIVFLGPSLPLDEARALVDADFRPPARQGDVFAALRAHPTALALIDGVFEASPSVWHHELLAAHASGVAVFGAASMGALRAAELPGVVTPVGVIAQQYLSGAWEDDAHVAVLHADGAGGFRALTLPHANVWATARAAQARRVLRPPEARALVAASEALFYQARTWPSVLAALRWPAAVHDRFQRFLEGGGAVDLKAEDARACLRALRGAPKPGRRPLAVARLSSFVRRGRLGSQPVAGAPRRGAEDAGVRTLLLAEFARLAGLRADEGAVAAQAAALPRRGWADDERWAAAEAMVLEAMVLAAPDRFVSDGPSRAEGLRLEVQRRAAGKGRVQR